MSSVGDLVMGDTQDEKSALLGNRGGAAAGRAGRVPSPGHKQSNGYFGILVAMMCLSAAISVAGLTLWYHGLINYCCFVFCAQAAVWIGYFTYSFVVSGVLPQVLPCGLLNVREGTLNDADTVIFKSLLDVADFRQEKVDILHGNASNPPVLPPQLVCVGLIFGPMLSAALVWATNRSCIEAYSLLKMQQLVGTHDCPESAWESSYRSSTPVLVWLLVLLPMFAAFANVLVRNRSDSGGESFARDELAKQWGLEKMSQRDPWLIIARHVILRLSRSENIRGSKSADPQTKDGWYPSGKIVQGFLMCVLAVVYPTLGRVLFYLNKACDHKQPLYGNGTACNDAYPFKPPAHVEDPKFDFCFICAIARDKTAIGMYAGIEFGLQFVATMFLFALAWSSTGACDNRGSSSDVEPMLKTLHTMCHPLHIQSLASAVQKIVAIENRAPSGDGKEHESAAVPGQLGSVQSSASMSVELPNHRDHDGNAVKSDGLDVVAAEGSMFGVPYYQWVQVQLQTIVEQVSDERDSQIMRVANTAHDLSDSSERNPSIFMRSTLAQRVHLLCNLLAWNDLGSVTQTTVEYLVWSGMCLLLLVLSMICCAVAAARTIPGLTTVQGEGTAGYFMVYFTLLVVLTAMRPGQVVRVSSDIAAILEVWPSLREYWNQHYRPGVGVNREESDTSGPTAWVSLPERPSTVIPATSQGLSEAAHEGSPDIVTPGRFAVAPTAGPGPDSSFDDESVIKQIKSADKVSKMLVAPPLHSLIYQIGVVDVCGFSVHIGTPSAGLLVPGIAGLVGAAPMLRMGFQLLTSDE